MYGFRAEMPPPKVKFDAMMFGMENSMHWLKVSDLIIFLIAVNVVDMEAIRDRPAMCFPYFAMEINRSLGDDIPRDVVTEFRFPPPLPAPCH
jgi:hypothetical protein